MDFVCQEVVVLVNASCLAITGIFIEQGILLTELKSASTSISRSYSVGANGGGDLLHGPLQHSDRHHRISSGRQHDISARKTSVGNSNLCWISTEPTSAEPSSIEPPIAEQSLSEPISMKPIYKEPTFTDTRLAQPTSAIVSIICLGVVMGVWKQTVELVLL